MYTVSPRRLGLVLVAGLTPAPAAPAQSPDRPVEVGKWTKHTGPVTRLAFVPKYPKGGPQPNLNLKAVYLMSASEDGDVLLWNVTEGKLFKRVDKIPEPIWAVAFNPALPQFYFGNHFGFGSIVRAVDLTNAKVSFVHETRCQNGVVIHALDLSPDGQVLALLGSDHKVQVFHREYPNDAKGAAKVDGNGFAVAFAPLPERKASDPRPKPKDDSVHRIAVGSGDGAVRLFDVAITWPRKGRVVTGPANVQVARLKPDLPKHDRLVTRVQFSRDGKYLASSSHDGTVLVADPASGRQIARLAVSDKAVEGVAFDPDGKLLAVASADGQVQVWDAKNWTRRWQVAAHTDAAMWVDFSPDGRYLASGGRDFVVRAWEVRP
jgi:WD40 repeat protein